MCIIRPIDQQDIQKILAIYQYYVENTAISFEYQVPSLSEFTSRVLTIQQKYPFLVLEYQDNLCGYAYASTFIQRDAYQYCAEVTIYLAPNMRGLGYGSHLYNTLEYCLKKQGVRTMYACIAHTEDTSDPYLNNASEQFHARLGFSLVGTFKRSGYKFHRWYDMIWMEKIINSDALAPPKFQLFPDIQSDVFDCQTCSITTSQS